MSAASTWNLERLEALASEVAALFYTHCQELGVAGDLQAASQVGPICVLYPIGLAIVFFKGAGAAGCVVSALPMTLYRGWAGGQYDPSGSLAGHAVYVLYFP